MNKEPSLNAERSSYRILVIDDNPAIHEDFRKVLGSSPSDLKTEVDGFAATLFGTATTSSHRIAFEIDSAFQGKEGLEKVRAAAAEGRPYAVAFVDIRMPPGWDGIETITHIWKEFTDLQIVICTAYSDYSWDEIAHAIGETDHVLVLKKPFDNVEVMQMAHALARKWELTRLVRRQMDDLEALVEERTAKLRATNEELIAEMHERSMAQIARQHADERFSMAFHGNAVPMAIRRWDLAGFVDANSAFIQLLGASREEALSEGGLRWHQPEMKNVLREAAETGEPLRDMPASIETVSGEMREVLVTSQMLKLNNVIYQLLILLDVTERMRLENELRQAQKMEAVGRLAAGVAHDFNNILTVILGNSTMHLTKGTLDDKLASSLRQVVRAAEQATALTRQLLAYSRKQILLRRPLSLNEVVEETVKMLRRLLPENITVELRLAPDLPLIFADSTNVDQVIMNLALNARDAMPHGGHLTIASGLTQIDAGDCAPNVDAKPGTYVRLSVRDTGIGMDQQTVRRIFEPFFTTKEQGRGTGMGLATVHGVLKQHAGWLEVKSALGEGTELSAFFPISENQTLEVAEVKADETPSTIEPSRYTILVVEDEEMLRDFVTDALSGIGYRTLAAANGRAALEIWENHRDEIDLLLTDVVMPDEPSGRQLAEQLIGDKPDLKVIFTSGYSPELAGIEFEQDLSHGFLSKPYVTDSLARTVAAHLVATEV